MPNDIERRTMPSGEIRSDTGEGGGLKFAGHAAVFNELSELCLASGRRYCRERSLRA